MIVGQFYYLISSCIVIIIIIIIIHTDCGQIKLEGHGSDEPGPLLGRTASKLISNGIRKPLLEWSLEIVSTDPLPLPPCPSQPASLISFHPFLSYPSILLSFYNTLKKGIRTSPRIGVEMIWDMTYERRPLALKQPVLCSF